MNLKLLCNFSPKRNLSHSGIGFWNTTPVNGTGSLRPTYWADGWTGWLRKSAANPKTDTARHDESSRDAKILGLQPPSARRDAGIGRPLLRTNASKSAAPVVANQEGR